MVDNLNMSSADDLDPSETETLPSGLKGFMRTSTGRLIGGGLAFLVVLGAFAAIAFVFVLEPSDSGLEPLVMPASGVESPVTTSAEDEEATERSTEPLSSTFVFRNVFAPTIKPVVESTASTTSTTTPEGDQPGGSSGVPADTLYLDSISTVDGVAVANLVWNGTSYQVSEGESIEGTPWQVLEITSTTVVMLYGDSRVTLTVGQGISK